MAWGFFTPLHIITLIAAALIILGLHFVLRNKSEKTQKIVLLCMSFWCIGCLIFDLFYYGSPFEYLPLHLCNVNGILLPFAVCTKNKRLNNLLLLWSLGALLALILNSASAHFVLFGVDFNKYYFSHVFEFGVPLLMFSLGLVEKDAKCMISTMIITFLTYTGIHFCNVGINTYLANNDIVNTAGQVIQVNYMYSLAPNNPLSELFLQLIPYKYWYNLPALPIMVVYLVGIYRKQLFAKPQNNI